MNTALPALDTHVGSLLLNIYAYILFFHSFSPCTPCQHGTSFFPFTENTIVGYVACLYPPVHRLPGGHNSDWKLYNKSLWRSPRACCSSSIMAASPSPSPSLILSPSAVAGFRRVVSFAADSVPGNVAMVYHDSCDSWTKRIRTTTDWKRPR